MAMVVGGSPIPAKESPKTPLKTLGPDYNPGIIIPTP